MKIFSKTQKNRPKTWASFEMRERIFKISMLHSYIILIKEIITMWLNCLSFPFANFKCCDKTNLKRKINRLNIKWHIMGLIWNNLLAFSFESILDWKPLNFTTSHKHFLTAYSIFCLRTVSKSENRLRYMLKTAVNCWEVVVTKTNPKFKYFCSCSGSKNNFDPFRFCKNKQILDEISFWLWYMVKWNG